MKNPLFKEISYCCKDTVLKKPIAHVVWAPRSHPKSKGFQSATSKEKRSLLKSSSPQSRTIYFTNTRPNKERKKCRHFTCETNKQQLMVSCLCQLPGLSLKTMWSWNLLSYFFIYINISKSNIQTYHSLPLSLFLFQHIKHELLTVLGFRAQAHQCW